MSLSTKILRSMHKAINIIKEDELPYSSSKWLNIGASFEKGIQLEGIFGPRELREHLDRLKETARDAYQFERREFLVAGRSNVGKSSLINCLVKNEVAYTSKYPGKTRQLYFFSVANSGGRVILVDPPGYGFAKGDKTEIQQWGKMLDNYFKHSPYLHRTFILVDAEHGLKQVDLMLCDLLDKRKRIIVFVFTKCDKIKEGEQPKLVEKIKELQNKYNLMGPIIHFTSAKTGFGISDLRANIAYMLDMDLLRG